MADIKLKRMVLRNWMKIKSAELVFPDRGVVLVTGSNLASGGKLLSVGSGKTSIGEALSRTLCGVNGRFASLGHFSSDDLNKDTYVRVDAELIGKPLVVETGYKCNELSKTGEGLRFTYDGKQVERGHIDQTRQELTGTIRVTPELADWTVFLDGDKLKFNRMGQKGVVDLLMTALAQPPWTAYHERSSGVLSKFKRNMSGEESTHTEAKNRLESVKRDLASAKSQLVNLRQDYDRRVGEHESKKTEITSQIEANKKVVLKLEQEQKDTEKKLRDLEDKKAQDYTVLETKRTALVDKEAVEASKRESALEKQLSAKSVLTNAKTALAAMLKVPKNCPTCKKPWDSAHKEEEISKSEDNVERAGAVYNTALDVYTAANTTYEEIRKKIRSIDGEMRDLSAGADTSGLSVDHERRTAQINRINRDNQTLQVNLARMDSGVDKTQLERQSAVIEQRQNDLESATVRVEETSKSLAQSTEALKVIEYWHKGFGPTGIPNMVLADAIAPLNSVAKRISNLMTGGTLEVNFSTSRQLASGDAKSELTVRVNNKIGSKRMEGSSKGEAGLTNLIIAETLSEVGSVSSRIGYRWYDEITGGQDPVVRRSIFAYMKDVAQRLGILIFVVDHHVEASSYADHVLVVEKTDEGTNLRWKH